MTKEKILKFLQTNYSGQSLIEFIVAIGLTAILLPALITGLVASREGKAQQNQRIDAANLANEAYEALRNIRERGWSYISTNGTYHPVISSNLWTLAEGVESVDGFQRQIDITDAYRDSTGAITESGGTPDFSTKKITIIVSWDTPFPYQTNSTVYLSRYLNDSSWTQTTAADFSGSGNSQTNLQITNTSGGEIMLSAAGPGRGDWCTPRIVDSLDLPRQGEARTLTAIPFEVFAGTGMNASGVSFADVSISDPAYPTPPAASLIGTFNGYKTNDVFGETGYAYLATDNNSKEIVIISTSSYTEIGSFNISGNVNASSIFVVNNVGFTASNDYLYTFNLSEKTGERPQIGSLQLASTIKSIYVVGSYAYVAINNTSNQLEIVNISNPASMSVTGSLSVNGAGAQNIYVAPDGNRIYLVTAASSNQPEFFIIHSGNKASPALVSPTSVYDTSGMDPKGVSMVLSGNRALLVGTGGEEYQVVDITNESAPTRCGGLNDDTGLYDAADVLEPDGDAYAYVVTGQASSELKIIEGGPGGQFSQSGEYESPPFPDLGMDLNFHRISANISKPASTDVKFKIAVADAVNGSCSGAFYNFIGPSADNPLAIDADAFFSTTAVNSDPFNVAWPIPQNNDGIGYENPGRCLKYKAYFSTADAHSSPVIYDVSVNYSP